ncbi:BREX-2 system adenine-specific DNA-methyltransferase PglX [Streptomyces sp. NPDC051569]|uniref:BREX-2 system adenine-specific DNA-methyltransferase PglX n=1 Tax=Streptomyces sp. NPDC051569 TaxID=3365661 RepID=UPI0037B38E0F
MGRLNGKLPVISSELLCRDLRGLMVGLRSDLRERAQESAAAAVLESDYARARKERTTSATWDSWRDEQIGRAAASWLLALTMIRFCEDNGMLDASALLAVEEPKDDSPLSDERAREAVFDVLARVRSLPVMGQVLSPRSNPLWKIAPSSQALRTLRSFWLRRSPEGSLEHDFTDATRDTRFLRDLYVALDEQATKSYGLVATPDFVADMILDLTVEPAVAESGLPGFRAVDPACGSGTFLLSLFSRLFHLWTDAEPGMSPWQRAARALRSVHGVDIDPCAVSVARFRLLVAAMNATSERRLSTVPDVPVVVAVGDSLLQGRGAPHVGDLALEEPSGISPRGEFSDYSRRHDLLGRVSYHAVVSNPSYLTVKDKSLSTLYHDAYVSCRGKYALTAPFTERAFELAATGRNSGYVGLLMANSFMKREFGRPLIEHVLSRVEVSRIIDTSGAYLPGHGTPTVVLSGRNHEPDPQVPVYLVVSKEGEPALPEVPSDGLVWQSLRAMSGRSVATEDRWARSFFQYRSELAHFPWSLTDPTSRDVLSRMEQGERLGERVARIGYQAATGSDDIFCAPLRSFKRSRAEQEACVQVVTGSGIRDWSVRSESAAFYPRAPGENSIRPKAIDLSRFPGHHRRLRPYWSVLVERPGIKNSAPWYDWHQVASNQNVHYWSIVFPWVATHPHFSLLREPLVPLNSAPVLKLSPSASENDHLELLGLLNSSAACFWLKHMSQSKGEPRIGQLRGGEAWERIFEFTSTRLRDLPLPACFPLEQAASLDAMATSLTQLSSSITDTRIPLDQEFLDSAESRWASTRSRMVAVQEELDWRVYESYGLLTDDCELASPLDEPPPLKVGERAFEIVLARKAQEGLVSTTWFERHGATPTTEIPLHWPAAYRNLVRGRIEAIEQHASLRLLEQPEHKRRWSTPGWHHFLRVGLRDRMLDRCERADLWFETTDEEHRPVARTVEQLANFLAADAEFVMLAARYSPGTRVLDVVQSLLNDTHVPAAPPLRYKESGLAKRSDWEAAWERQWASGQGGDGTTDRQEQTDPTLFVPPRYTSADFVKPSYWQQRGKHDVPNERFASYLPPFSPLSSATVLGWAGWDAHETAQVLLDLVESGAHADAGGLESMFPLLAALQDILRRVQRTEADLGPTVPSGSYQVYEETFRRHVVRLGTSQAEIAGWRPPAPRRGRPRKES